MDVRQRAALLSACRSFWHREDVTGIDIGFKLKKDKLLATRCVRFHVKEKRLKTQLAKTHIFPSAVKGIPTDVIAATYYPRNGAMNPFPALSLSDSPLSYGTLGCYVRDVGKQGVFALTCAHVLQRSIRGESNGIVFNPSPNFQPPGVPLGSLARYIWRDQMDVALVALPDVNRAPPLPVSLVGVSSPFIGQILQKWGVSTGKTAAKVVGEGIYHVDYGDRRLSFKAICLKPLDLTTGQISFEGDSGAMWYDPGSSYAVAMNLAGEDTPYPEDEYSLALPMQNICKTLNVELYK